MKKILSLILAIAVLSFSTSAVFAAVAISDAGDGNMLIDKTTIPAGTYYEAVTPSTSIAVTQYTTKAALKDAAGTAFSNQANPEGAYDAYKLEVTISNLGELVNGLDDENWEAAFTGIYNVLVTFPTTAFSKKTITAGQIAGGTAAVAQDAQDSTIFNLTWTAAALGNPYPIFDSEADPLVSSYVANASMTLTFFVGVTKGTELNLSNVGTTVTYTHSVEGRNIKNTNAANTSLQLPPAPAYVEITTAKPKTTVAQGTAGLTNRAGEEATIGQNYGITEFIDVPVNTALYNYKLWAKDSANNEMTEKDINFAQYSIEGTASFYVIIKSGSRTISDVKIRQYNK